jgi:cytochrome c biogenesis protein CcmG/thiol:disulfide interchange protein DsbE
VKTTRRQSWFVWVGLLVPLVVLLVLFTVGMMRHDRALAISDALARGQTPAVPDIVLPAFAGPPVSLSDFRGHPVVLNFWASWCVPCREEAPLLQHVWEEFHPRGLVVVGVDTQDLAAPAREFVARYGLSFPSVRDADGSVARRFGTTGVPETFFIAANGLIVGKFPGEQVSPAVWRAAAEALLEGRTPIR